MVRDGDKNLEGPTPMGTPNKEILLCVYGGEVREVSVNVGLTSLTSTLGGCGVATKECSCTRVMNPSGYRVVSQWLCCYGGWGLHSSVSGVTLSILAIANGPHGYRVVPT